MRTTTTTAAGNDYEYVFCMGVKHGLSLSKNVINYKQEQETMHLDLKRDRTSEQFVTLLTGKF
jgi:hypothetical protein